MAVAHLAQADQPGHLLQFAIAGDRQVRQSSGWSVRYSSITPRRTRRTRSLVVGTFMPGATGVVQDAGVPARPSISTRHTRQEPNASSESVAQSFGT